MLGQHVSGHKVSALESQARRLSAPWLLLDGGAFRSAYNRKPFLVEHRLTEHPLFELGALTRLCRRLPPEQVRYRFGVVPDDTDFNVSLKRYREGLSLDDAIDKLEEKQAYIAVYNAETDPEYRPVIEGLLGELAARTEPLEPGMNWYSTYIFISARDSVTPYHMDREMNFLLQIRGKKTVKLWDPGDDEIMSPAVKDKLLAERHDPLPAYRSSFDQKAMTFELAPGLGVHHPFIAPHLVKTGPNLSISFAITFRTQRSDVWSDAHCLSHRLRTRLGSGFGKVGQHPLLDNGKASLLRFSRQLRRLF